jgi:hypothetical protein
MFSSNRQYLEVSGQLHDPAALSQAKEPPIVIEFEAALDPEAV